MTDSPPLPSPRRAIPSLEDFLKGISSENPAGSSLRYGPAYDGIRLARQEDDTRLSMGIWKTDLKRADWGKVESLCLEVLTTQSKDLQVAGWLTEAWVSLDGIYGYIRGIRLFSSLIGTFWATIHPQPDDDGDMEYRLMIFEWMDKSLSSRLLPVPLTQSRFDQTGFGLGFFKSAQYNDACQKRVEKTTRNAPATSDPSKAIGTLEDFQRSLDQTSDAYLSQCLQSIAEALQATQALKETLSTLLGADSPSFSQILGALKEMERISKTALQARKPVPSPPSEEPIAEGAHPDMPALAIMISTPHEAPAVDLPPVGASGTPALKTRHDAYRRLEAIAAFLEQSDPHSLAPQLLRQLIRWENKTIVDIFDDIAKTPQEQDILMKILGVSQKG